MNYSHICISVTGDCINNDSYGEICVHCNACGRFDKSTQKQCALKMYKEKLQEEYDFDDWIDGFEKLQRSNVASNIEYFKKKIEELEAANE